MSYHIDYTYVSNIFFNVYKPLIITEYVNVFILLLLSIVLALIILSLSYFLSVQNPDTEKLSAYECGFEPYEDARIKFDIKFYIVAILFVVFDIEAIFLFPWSITLGHLDVLGFWAMVDFVFELGLGFVYVWFMGALDWE